MSDSPIRLTERYLQNCALANKDLASRPRQMMTLITTTVSLEFLSKGTRKELLRLDEVH